MNARFLLAVVLSLSFLGEVAFGGSPDWPIESVIPVSFAGESRQISLASDAVESPRADGQLPAPITVATPPSLDPDSPDWGQYLHPTSTPTVQRPVEYSLIGPPVGIIQHDEGQEYRAVVSDPNTVFDFDSRMGQTIDIFRPDGMGPAGMFGDHTLPAGAVFISYRYLQNSYEQNYNGSHRSGPATSFPFAPTHMMQDSQVALVEYGVTQDWTVVASLPFQHNEITSQTATGNYKTTFTNPGDIRVMGLLVIGRGDRSQSHVNFGMSFPVGFLEQQTVIGTVPAPSPTVPNLPYQIRTSSGTYDLLFGYTYRKQTDNWTWGGQANTVMPTGKNTLGYELGIRFKQQPGFSRRWSERWSTSARLDGHIVENIHGADNRLDQTLSPANQPKAQATRYLNGLLGVYYLLLRPEHRIREQRLFLESGIPL